MPEQISLWIPGQPPRKSNNRRIVRSKRGPRLIKSQEALDWMEAACACIPPECRLGWGSPDQPIRVTCYCYYETHRPDLSVELVLDTLQMAGVISDDRYVYEIHAYKEFSKRMPGVRVLARRI
jgi:Holliday junction resolvase RusA-like endonuclease